MTLQDFLRRLRSVRRSGDGFSALCPAHEDTERSLSVTERDDKILARCFKGCTIQQICAGAQCTVADLFTKPPSSPAPAQRRLVATYDYCAPDGTLLYQNVRYEPKTFRIRRPDGQGGWLWSLGETRRVVYRLPELAEQRLVYLVEGEKDADRLWSLGLPATTAAAGAESWRPEYASQLAEAGVQEAVLLPDNDEPGIKYMRAAADSLRAAGLRVLTVRLPDLPPVKGSHGEDISDWLDAGHTLDEFAAVVAAAHEAADSRLPIPLSRLFASPPPEPKWLVQDLLRERANGWIGAGAKVGKSWAALDLLLACALGKPWLDQFAIARPLTVVLVEEEDDDWRVYQRSVRLCLARGCGPPDTFHVLIRKGYRLDDEVGLAPLVSWFRDWRPDLIVWDVFNRLHLKDERKPDQIMPVLWRLDQLRNEIGCSNLVAHHSRKPGTAGPDMASGGQRLRGPSEFWGWAENSLYLTPLKGKGHVIVEPESKDAIVDPFKAHLEDLPDDSRRWVYDGVVQARLDQGNENRKRIMELLSQQPHTVQQLTAATDLSDKTVSAHLRTLRAEGLAEFVKEPGRAGRKLWMAPAGPDARKMPDDRKAGHLPSVEVDDSTEENGEMWPRSADGRKGVPRS